jgi:threonine aldolase
MREAIASAEVGDDVFGEDPTVRALEDEVAAIVGKEAALFVTSGTMGNQLAIAVHTRPGEEVVVGDGAHVIHYESGAGPALSGIQFAVAGAGGFFDEAELDERIQPFAYWCPKTSLVCLENTHNRAGGRVFPQEQVVRVAELAHTRGLAVHLDGARIWNASVATGLRPAELAVPVDTISVCFSKGLGAPVGSAFVGTRAHVERARHLRKRWGGAMRQSGLLAAAALHALRHHRDRIGEDHANAKRLAERVARVARVRIDVAKVETNIVNIDLDAPLTAEAVAKNARAMGLAINPSAPRRLRAVTHLDVSESDVNDAAEILEKAIAGA